MEIDSQSEPTAIQAGIVNRFFLLSGLAMVSLPASLGAIYGLTDAPAIQWPWLLGGWMVGAIQGGASPLLHAWFMRRLGEHAAFYSLAYLVIRQLIFLSVCGLVFAFYAQEAVQFALSLLVTFFIMLSGEGFLLCRWANNT